jgi:hypothetical protein
MPAPVPGPTTRTGAGNSFSSQPKHKHNTAALRARLPQHAPPVSLGPVSVRWWGGRAPPRQTKKEEL